MFADKVFDWSCNKGPLYLYLSLPEWADAWVNGGPVPLNPVSAYRSMERKATLTPDEVVQREFSPFIEPPMEHLLGELGGSVWFDGCNVDLGTTKYENVCAWSRVEEEDALVLCFGRVLSAELRDRLSKSTVILINDPLALLQEINAQLSVSGYLACVGYTSGYERHHCLKSKADAWQFEARMLWHIDPAVETFVNVAPGTGRIVDCPTSQGTNDGTRIDTDLYDKLTGRSGKPTLPKIILDDQISNIHFRDITIKVNSVDEISQQGRTYDQAGNRAQRRRNLTEFKRVHRRKRVV